MIYSKPILPRPQFPMMAILRSVPQAIAHIAGSSAYFNIEGLVRFYQTKPGVIVYAEINGLPALAPSCQSKIFGFHIHEGAKCSGNTRDPFADALSHYNPKDCKHPYHAGDLPPLFGNKGVALSIFLTDRFSVQEIIGRTVIIHDMPDDFTTQPAGSAGTKIACGLIQKTARR